MTIIIEPWQLALLFLPAVVLVVIFAVKVWRDRRVHHIRFPQHNIQLLKHWTAEQLSTLTDEQQEAVRLWAWSERQGWRTVAENVQLGSEYPLAKKALPDAL